LFSVPLAVTEPPAPPDPPVLPPAVLPPVLESDDVVLSIVPRFVVVIVIELELIIANAGVAIARVPTDVATIAMMATAFLNEFFINFFTTAVIYNRWFPLCCSARNVARIILCLIKVSMKSSPKGALRATLDFLSKKICCAIRTVEAIGSDPEIIQYLLLYYVDVGIIY
jgi:hypothetical protein